MTPPSSYGSAAPAYVRATIYSLNCHEGAMLSTICLAKQKSLQICAELRRYIVVRDGSRTESGNEFHSDGAEMEKLQQFDRPTPVRRPMPRPYACLCVCWLLRCGLNT